MAFRYGRPAREASPHRTSSRLIQASRHRRPVAFVDQRCRLSRSGSAQCAVTPVDRLCRHQTQGLLSSARSNLRLLSFLLLVSLLVSLLLLLLLLSLSFSLSLWFCILFLCVLLLFFMRIIENKVHVVKYEIFNI